MKKLIVVLVILIAAISCSKKTTGNKTVGTVTETPPIVVKKVEESSIVKANTETAPASPNEDATAAKEKMNITLRAAGKEAYSVKCTRCHEAFEPNKFEAAKWEKLLDWMGPRAKLEAHEKEAILAYVKYNAKK